MTARKNIEACVNGQQDAMAAGEAKKVDLEAARVSYTDMEARNALLDRNVRDLQMSVQSGCAVGVSDGEKT